MCVVALCSVDSRASHPGCEPETGEDLGEDMRLFLVRSGVSGFTRPDEFDLCGCWFARRLGYIGDYVKPMESFVGSFTPQRAGKRSVQA